MDVSPQKNVEYKKRLKLGFFRKLYFIFGVYTNRAIFNMNFLCTQLVYTLKTSNSLKTVMLPEEDAIVASP